MSNAELSLNITSYLYFKRKGLLAIYFEYLTLKRVEVWYSNKEVEPVGEVLVIKQIIEFFFPLSMAKNKTNPGSDRFLAQMKV